MMSSQLVSLSLDVKGGMTGFINVPTFDKILEKKIYIYPVMSFV